jgi:AhpD family alkylhydroperoxidase
MKLDYRIRELIAIGTSVGANCHSCLEYHFGKAREQGIPIDEITEAIEVGKMVRKGRPGQDGQISYWLVARNSGFPSSPIRRLRLQWIAKSNCKLEFLEGE